MSWLPFFVVIFCSVFCVAHFQTSCLFPVKQRIGKSSSQTFIRITPSYERFYGLFPTIIHFISSENRSIVLQKFSYTSFREELNDQKIFLPISNEEFLVLSNNNTLSGRELQPISNVSHLKTTVKQ